MKKNNYTVELARLYENQGYHTLALEQYSSLLRMDEKNTKLSDAVKRVKLKIDQGEKGAANGRIAVAFEEWLNLLILKNKLMILKSFRSTGKSGV